MNFRAFFHRRIVFLTKLYMDLMPVFILFILYQPPINDDRVICPRRKSMHLYLMNITGYCPQQQQKMAHCLTISSKICVRSIKIYLIPTRYYLVLRCELMHRNVSFHHLIRWLWCFVSLYISKRRQSLDCFGSAWHHYSITTLWHDLFKFDLFGKFDKNVRATAAHCMKFECCCSHLTCKDNVIILFIVLFFCHHFSPFFAFLLLLLSLSLSLCPMCARWGTEWWFHASLSKTRLYLYD